MQAVVLKQGRDKSVRNHHPWIFSGGIAKVQGNPAAGETVAVVAANGAFLGYGAYSPASQIRVRMWSFAPAPEIDAAFFQRRLRAAITARQPLAQSGITGYRLVNAESDGLPGLVVDRYADYLVCQFMAVGVEHWQREIVAALSELVPCRGIYERSDGKDREKEGLQPRTGPLFGTEPQQLVEIKENGYRLLVDIQRGQKTGLFLDQRQSRAALSQFAPGASVLNCFAYTGGFGMAALAGGAAQVVNVDSSASALAMIQRHAELNGVAPGALENIEGDAFQLLRKFYTQQRLFDIVVLDPPKFAASRDQLDAACRGYKDINLQGFKLLKPGGLLFTFSCSSHMVPELFNKIVADAALDAGREAQIIRRLAAGSDHPTALAFPEGNYLKGLICRCVDI